MTQGSRWTEGPGIADARLIFHPFLSSLSWIHNLYLKAFGPPGPAPPGRGRPKAHYGRPTKAKGSFRFKLPAQEKQHPPSARAMRGCIKERNNRESPERRLWTVVDHVGEARGPADSDYPTAHRALVRPVEQHRPAY